MTCASGPLSGLTVVDLSRILAGPYCTMLMAELGARVIKVEQPGVGDDARAYGPFVNGKSAYFTSINRGKESIALDLKVSSDRAIFDELLTRADVLVENFRPGTMEKLGYGWEQVRSSHPRLIYVSASGFGQTGPDARRPAYDMVVQAMGGIMSLTGHPGAPPARVGISIGDIGAGLYTAVAVNAAIYRRSLTGEGIRVDVAMYDCQLALLESAIVRHLATGEIPGPLGSRHPSIAPFQAFKTAEGDLVVAAGNDGLFRRLCSLLGLSHLADDPRFQTNEDRCRNVGLLEEILGAVFCTRTTEEWSELLQAAGIPAGPINTVDKAVRRPQVAARNMIVDVHDPVMGTVRVVGNPIKIEGVDDAPIRSPAPNLDEHRDAILNELASFAGPAKSDGTRRTR